MPEALPEPGGASPDPVLSLLGVVQETVGAVRVEAVLHDSETLLAVGGPVGARTAEVLEVLDDGEPLVDVRVYGGRPDLVDDVLPAAASLMAVVAAGARRESRERAWVGRLGHDLKTPLTAVLGFAGLLSGGGVSSAGPPLVAAAGEVTGAGERLLADLEEELAHWRQAPSA